MPQMRIKYWLCRIEAIVSLGVSVQTGLDVAMNYVLIMEELHASGSRTR